MTILDFSWHASCSCLLKGRHLTICHKFCTISTNPSGCGAQQPIPLLIKGAALSWCYSLSKATATLFHFKQACSSNHHTLSHCKSSSKASFCSWIALLKTKTILGSICYSTSLIGQFTALLNPRFWLATLRGALAFSVEFIATAVGVSAV
jgi:hypothetical protein